MFRLLQNREVHASGFVGHGRATGSAGVEADYVVFRRAEVSYARNVVGHRRRAYRVLGIHPVNRVLASSQEDVASFGTAARRRRGQRIVDQAGAGRGGYAG